MSASIKIQFKKLPVFIRVLTYLGGNYSLIFIAQIISGLTPVKGEMAFNLLLCVLLLCFTKFILWMEGKSFIDIGITTGNRKDILNLSAGTLAGIAMLVTTALSIKLITGFHWQHNPLFQWYQLFTLFITIFCSAFVQELAFRGYPFRLMLDKWGEWPAQIITALLFGLMHLDGSMQLKGILLTMFTTGTGSIIFGMAVIKTNRLHLAVGIHFGWNYLQYLLPRHPSQNGKGIWLLTGGNFNLNYFTWISPYIIIMLIVFAILKYPGGNHAPKKAPQMFL